MKLLLALLDSQQTDIVLAVIHTLSKILRSERMKSSWCNFLELILLKIIDCYKTHKDVSKIHKTHFFPYVHALHRKKILQE